MIIRKIPIAQINPGFGHWLAGFTDGEGCFSFRCSNRSSGAIEWQPSFAIRLRADDEAILRECQQRTGIGVLKGYASRTNQKGITSKPTIVWEVRNIAECLRICEIFDRYSLRAKKKRDFETWKATLQTLISSRGNKWHGARDNSPLHSLVAKLRQERRFCEDNKYSNFQNSGSRI